MKFPRHQLALDKKALRKFLAKPIRAYSVKDATERLQLIKEQTDARIEAMFALFDIPADWPEDLQWHQLAFCLAGEAFAGCRTLSRGLGDPTRETLKALGELKRDLFEKFEFYKRAHPDFSESAAARNFLNKNRAACQAVDLSKPRSFTKAMKEVRKKYSTETEAVS